jgi:cysteine desulfurase
LAPVVEAAQRVGAVVHSDAVQAAGKLDIDFATSGVQLMSLSAHKLYGPKGVGALIRDRAVDLTAVMAGGGQEEGLRGGTENLPGIVGFGRAAELALAEMGQRREHLLALRDELIQGISATPELSGAVLFGVEAQRLPNTLMFALPGVEGETLLMELDRKGLAVSSGSACSAGSTEPSHVLTAMGVTPELARNAIRVSLGKDNGSAEVQRLLQLLRDLMVKFGRMARA